MCHTCKPAHMVTYHDIIREIRPDLVITGDVEAPEDAHDAIATLMMMQLGLNPYSLTDIDKYFEWRKTNPFQS